MVITNDHELDVTIVEPQVHRTTTMRRRRRLEELAWEEFANGGPQTTPRSAMRRALNRYLPDVGLWVKSCTACTRPFVASRRDAITCSEACRSASHRRKRRIGDAA